MALFSRQELLTSYYKGLSITEQRNLKSYPSQADYNVFLSHSHKDKEIAKGLIFMLAREGVSVYVDWEDSELPEKPGRETANKIKRVIKGSDLFLLLATDNALNSKWVPWELGVADEAKGTARIILAATEDASSKGSEYLDIYRRVEKLPFTSGLRVIGPKASAGVPVKSYFTSPQAVTG